MESLIREALFKAPSENPSVVFIFPEEGKVIYGKTSYNGEGFFVSKKDLESPVEKVIGLHIEPKQSRIELNELPDEIKGIAEVASEAEKIDAKITIFVVKFVKSTKTGSGHIYSIEDKIDEKYVTWYRVFSVPRGKRGQGEKEWPKFQLKAKELGLETYKVEGSKMKWDCLAVKYIPNDTVSMILQSLPKTTEQALKPEEEVITPEKVSQAVSSSAEELELEEVKVQEVQPTPKRQELVPLYLLAFEMPSAYLSVYNYTSNAEFEERRFEVNVRSVLEGYRNRFYREISRIFFNAEFGWITVTEEGVKEAERLNNEAIEAIKTAMKNTNNPAVMKRLENALKRRFVKAVKIYLEANEAKEILETAIRKMSEEIEELQAKINNAEKASMKKKLSQALEWLIQKKIMFEKYLRSL